MLLPDIDSGGSSHEIQEDTGFRFDGWRNGRDVVD
jgi:hypothetical protein